MASSGVRRRSSAKKSADTPTLPDSRSVGVASSSFSSSRPSSISKLDQTFSAPQPSPSAQLAELMGPPPVPTQPEATGQSRASTASSTTSGIRSLNPKRLSLTLPLPIALPSPDPTRPAPSSAASVSHPPNSASSTFTTSNGTNNMSWATSDADPSNFIIAIAAQERRVLELREELGHAETELVILKNQWTKYEGTRKRGATRNSGIHSTPSTPRGSGPSTLHDDAIAARRSIELDRRRIMLLSQQSTPGSPRRRVLRGGHARTLSLLSPIKTDGSFSLHGHEPMSATLDLERRSTDIGSAYRSAALQKRASWQPRVRHANSAVPSSSMGMAAIVEDLKLGFRTLATFVDDIRQVTVGDEPISGQARRRHDEEWTIGGGLSQSTAPSKDSNDRRQTIRPSTIARPALNHASEPPGSNTLTPTKASKDSLLDEVDPVADRGSVAAARKKHFSWAPLEFSNLDEEWAAWDSPLSTKSTRWSESNDTSSDDSSTKNGETDTPLKQKITNASTLDDLLPQVVNRLSPGNLKRATSNFMGQWEKSLPAPSSPAALVAMADDKENLISF